VAQYSGERHADVHAPTPISLSVPTDDVPHRQVISAVTVAPVVAGVASAVLAKLATVGQHARVAASLCALAAGDGRSVSVAGRLLVFDGAALERVVEQILLQVAAATGSMDGQGSRTRSAVCSLLAGRLATDGGLKYLLVTKFSVVRG
jgi:hypothetical protein